jgi:hypothetical protein
MKNKGFRKTHSAFLKGSPIFPFLKPAFGGVRKIEWIIFQE